MILSKKILGKSVAVFSKIEGITLKRYYFDLLIV